MERLAAALRYTQRGVAVVPVHPDKRKNPHLLSITEYFYRLPTPHEWRRWANRWPGCNLAIITGYWGLVALDFDTVEAYQEWTAGPGYGIRGQTWTVATARGYHVWFDMGQADPGESRSYTQGDHEVLLRAKGGYCIVPPSIHHTGAKYRTVHKVEPFRVDSLDYYLQGWALKTQPAKTSDLGRSAFAASAGPVRIETLIKISQNDKPNARGAILAYCPFHPDDNPSAWVNIEQQRFGCNACFPGQWFDVVNVVAMQRGISNGEAFLEVKGVQA